VRRERKREGRGSERGKRKGNGAGEREREREGRRGEQLRASIISLLRKQHTHTLVNEGEKAMQIHLVSLGKKKP